jgi:hypothetical protein
MGNQENSIEASVLGLLDKIIDSAAPINDQEEAKNKIIPHKSILSALLNELKPINFHEKANLSDGETLTISIT